MKPIAFVDNNQIAHKQHDVERDECLNNLDPSAGSWEERYWALAEAAWESGWDSAIIAYEKYLDTQKTSTEAK